MKEGDWGGSVQEHLPREELDMGWELLMLCPWGQCGLGWVQETHPAVWPQYDLGPPAGSLCEYLESRMFLLLIWQWQLCLPWWILTGTQQNSHWDPLVPGAQKESGAEPPFPHHNLGHPQNSALPLPCL